MFSSLNSLHLTKINNVKHFYTLIIGNGTKQSSHCIDSNILNISQVAPKMFYKLNASFHLFPKFNMPIHTSRYHEIRPETK